MSAASSRIASLAVAITLPLLLVAVVEGCSSGLIALRAALDGLEAPSIRRHDERLGWVSLPDLALRDFWGPGSHLHTNARAHRGTSLVDAAVPDGRYRIFCTGDSFAFGEGVGDEDTFCHLLGAGRPRIETVNLGQSGYGVDQAFLRYAGEAREIEAHLLLFTFIGPDLSRAGDASFYGFAKPVYRLRDGELVLEGVPVPETGPTIRRFLTRLGEELRVTEFVHRGRKKLFGERKVDADAIFERLGPTLEQLFFEVAREAGRHGTEVLFVYLPLRSEVLADGRWRGWVRERFAESGLPLLDLTEALRRLPEEEAHALFIPDGAPAGGHYAKAGNAWAAQVIGEALAPRIASGLADDPSIDQAGRPTSKAP